VYAESTSAAAIAFPKRRKSHVPQHCQGAPLELRQAPAAQKACCAADQRRRAAGLLWSRPNSQNLVTVRISVRAVPN
jgi:hypothetical protein